MRKLLFSIIISFSLFACQDTDPRKQLENITGYWEIRKVEVSEDSVMNYGMSEYIDYIEIKDSLGFRKKLKPKFGGGYTEMNKAENVKPRIENEKLWLYYSTPFDDWKEEVIEAGEEKLVVKSEDGKIYHYRKYEPILAEDYEEKEE